MKLKGVKMLVYIFLLMLGCLPAEAMEKPEAAVGTKQSAEERLSEMNDEKAPATKRSRQDIDFTIAGTGFHQSAPVMANASQGLAAYVQAYKENILLAKFYQTAQKAVQDRVNEQRKELCYISADIMPPITFDSNLPASGTDNKIVYTLVAIDGQSFNIPHAAAQLSGTLRKMTEDIDYANNIPLAVDSSSLDCIVHCITALLSMDQATKEKIENPQAFIHQLYKPFVSETHFLNLCEAVHRLDIPLLNDYLIAYTASYIIQESNMKKLSCFLEQCEKKLSVDFLKLVATKLLNARRTAFIRYLAKKSVYETEAIPFLKQFLHNRSIHAPINIPHKIEIIAMDSPKEFTLFNSLNPSERIKIIGVGGSGPLGCIPMHDPRIPETAKSVAVDIKGEYLLYENDDLSVMRLNVSDSSKPLCISNQATLSTKNFGYDDRFNIYIRYSGSETVILDPRYAMPVVIIPSNPHLSEKTPKLIAYNSEYALIRFGEVNPLLFRIEDDGSIKDVGFFYHDAGYDYFTICEDSIIGIHSKGKTNIIQDKTKECNQRVAGGSFLQCTKDGFVVLYDKKYAFDERIIFYDIRTQTYICCTFDKNFEIYNSFITDDGTRLYLICLKNGIRDRKFTFFVIDLFGDILQQPHTNILAYLACLLHSEKAHEFDAYLRTIFNQIPDDTLDSELPPSILGEQFPMYTKLW